MFGRGIFLSKRENEIDAMRRVKENWYWCIAGVFILFAFLVFLVVGEDSYIAVHDNMDLFVAQYKMLKDTHTFFAHGVDVPFLGGISRDNLPSELALTSVFYMLFPAFWGYVLNYLAKLVLAVVGSYLLAGEVCKKDNETYAPYKYLSVLCGLAYGMLNLFPNFGIPFATIPLAVYILLKIDRAVTLRAAIPWYVALFVYPFVSYFSYHGLFLCGYLLIAVIWVSIARKKVAKRLLVALPVLALGFVCFEYRLFSVMLFGKEETIRGLMVGQDLSIPEMLRETWDVLVNGMMHVESLHAQWVMPLCMLYFVILNVYYLMDKKPGKMFHDWYNFLIVFLFVNALVYGLWDYKPLRDLVATLCPPLEGFQYNRTIFFNPCLWYAALFLMLYRGVQFWHSEVCRSKLDKLLSMHTAKSAASSKKKKSSGFLKIYLADIGAVAVIFVAMAITFFSDTRYNDLMHTCYRTALHVIKGKEIDPMNYGEFYSTDLFAEAKEAVGYEGEWAVAYGLHPAVLEYNGIATLDGYLGYYSTEYKSAFRKVIAPALDRVEGHRINYDNWGARAYIYPGTEMPVVTEFKVYGPLEDYSLYMDVEAFHDLQGTYIFSRVPVDNTAELGLTMVFAKDAGEPLQNGEAAPYGLYVYK